MILIGFGVVVTTTRGSGPSRSPNISMSHASGYRHDARLREPRRCRKLPEAELRDACGTGARLVVGRGAEAGQTRGTSAHNLIATVFNVKSSIGWLHRDRPCGRE